MANVSRPFGARPVMYKGGAVYSGAARMYCIPASDGTACTIGDLVKLVGTADANGVAIVARLSNGSTDVPVGAIVGFVYDKNYDSQIHRSASTLRYALVADDPNLLFEMQASGTYGYATDAGLNSGVTVTAISTTTGLSNMQVDLATKATTATLPVKIIGAKQGPDNDATDTSNVRLLVSLNNHAFSNGVTGV